MDKVAYMVILYMHFKHRKHKQFSFYSGTGQGGSGGGPGTGKAVLYTPGMSMEVLGDGLKVRNVGDISQLPAKIIKCKKGDLILDCENGNILLRAKNIFVDAEWWRSRWSIHCESRENCRHRSARYSTSKVKKLQLKPTKDMTVIAKGQFELRYGFMVAAAFADESFGALTANLKKTQLSTQRTL